MSSNSPLSERMRDLQSNLSKNKTVEDIVVLLASNWKVFNSENPFVTASKVYYRETWRHNRKQSIFRSKK